jgi:hypothetical protein
MSAKEIFDKSLSLEDGETLLVPCLDLRQQESLRVSLAYHRRLFLDKSSANFEILVSKVQQEGRAFVSISKAPRITSGFIVSKDGSTRLTSLKPTPMSAIARGGLEISRMREAMLEDGMTPDEIAAYFASSQEVSNIDVSGCTLSPEELEEGK